MLSRCEPYFSPEDRFGIQIRITCKVNGWPAHIETGYREGICRHVQGFGVFERVDKQGWGLI